MTIQGQLRPGEQVPAERQPVLQFITDQRSGAPYEGTEVLPMRGPASAAGAERIHLAVDSPPPDRTLDDQALARARLAFPPDLAAFEQLQGENSGRYSAELAQVLNALMRIDRDGDVALGISRAERAKTLCRQLMQNDSRLGELLLARVLGTHADLLAKAGNREAAAATACEALSTLTGQMDGAPDDILGQAVDLLTLLRRLDGGEYTPMHWAPVRRVVEELARVRTARAE